MKETEKEIYLKEKNRLFKELSSLGCLETSSIEDPRENSLIFARSFKFYNILLSRIADRNIKNIYLILDKSVEGAATHKNIRVVERSNYAEILFAEYHNSLSMNEIKDKISDSAFVHSSSSIGLTGLWVRKTPDERVIKMKHVGNVILEDGVYIDACTTVHRGTFGSTIIKKNTILSCHINVGHNCEIGENCFIGPHVGIGGSTKIGNNVNIWQGAMIRNGIEICSNVVIGMGSIVTKSIKIPGTYMGTPARMISHEIIKV